MLEIEQTKNELNQCLKTLRQNGIAYAEAKRNYGIALSKKILELRTEGYPATLIPDLARGSEEVAELRFKRDIAESYWKANTEAVNVKKIELNILKTIYEKEWSNT